MIKKYNLPNYISFKYMLREREKKQNEITLLKKKKT